LNKTNNPPAGVLGIGMEAFLSPGVHAPESQRFGRVEKGLVDVAQNDDSSRASSAFGLLLSSLRNRTDWVGPWHKRAVMAWKYLLRVACVPVRHARFLSFVEAHPPMQAYRQRNPRMLERHTHRYMNVHMSLRQRVEQVQQHYRFALTHLPTALFDQVYASGSASLGSLTAKDGSLLTLCMRPPIENGCEGELSLQLCDANGNSLYSIVFAVSDETPSIRIGCLQGPRGENTKELVRELTRNMHGMRPKQLMLSLVYTFARHYGIKQLMAISNEAHPLRRKGRAIFSDYDAFWEEQQGKRVKAGWYALPSALPCKTEAEVPSNHRSAFRKREALRLQAEQLLMSALAQPVLKLPEFVTQRRPSATRPLRGLRVETSWVS
jgi:uncharacterized protein